MTQDSNHTIVNALRAVIVAAMVSLTGTQALADGVVVKGNVYGGGNKADVKRNTEVNICATYDETNQKSVALPVGDGITIEGSVFGGGKGVADNFTCDKAMVGENNSGETVENYAYGNTTVRIGNGTIGTGTTGGDVYGGGEIGRVEMNTTVEIGSASGTSEPIIKGHVFGAGKGLETHGYSALVRGNSTVTIQAKAHVWQNVHGGGEKASVGRYYVAQTQEDANTYHVRIGMPCFLKAGGKCSVNIQDEATIGKADIDDSGDVYGAGQGVTPIYNNDENDANRSKRMVYKNADHNDSNRDLWDYYADEDGNVDYGFVWEYFNTKDNYLLYVETLGRASETDVVIGGTRKTTGESPSITASENAPTVKGTVYGGSESGFVYKSTEVNMLQGTVNGDVFGGGKGLLSFAEAGRVRINTNLTISDGTVEGNVYGGGSLGDVGRIKKNASYNYMWTDQTDPAPDPDSYSWNNTGVCNVTINGGTIGTGVTQNSDGTFTKGNVYGAGRGSDITWWCEKAIAYATNVTITAGTVNGTVYGGGQVGRVETDATVTIGVADATGDAAPIISGNVFGAGAGLATHGYSALVRGNAAVTVQGTAQIGGSVYGGGEIASVGKFEVVGGLPTKPKTGGTCIVNIKDNAKIGESGTGHNVYGACKGVTPAYVASGDNRSKSMQLLANAPSDGSLWSHYDNDESSPFIWRYYTSVEDYLAFLKTLALTSHPHVTIGGTWTPNETTGTITASGTPTVYGSVYGGGQRGVTLGHVDVNMVGGTVEQDVYGGGALADTNLGNWDANGYVVATALNEGESITDLYERSGAGTAENPYVYTKITDPETTIGSGTYYRQEATWAHENGSAYYTTTVDLTGGTIKGDAYGGGLGQKTGFNGASSDVAAVVWGDIDVTLDGTKFDITYYTDEGYTGVVKSGRVFGCNNLLGSPQGDVTVTVERTVAGNKTRTTAEVKASNKAIMDAHPDNYTSVSGYVTPIYEVAAVYGGGNLAPYEAEGKKAHVIINGCDATSIQTVYGGGNAAAVPETDVDINSCYEIGSVFGGGNGKDKYKNDSGWQINPGANVNGNTDTMIYGGTVHEAYGASNEKGTIYGDVVIDVGENQSGEACTLDVAKLVGAGKNADVNGDLIIVMGCKPNNKIPLVYGGADNANVNGDVELTITSGWFGQVFGGNNENGCIMGHIKLNIEETGTCDTPIKIEKLYLGGNQAAYSQYGYYYDGTDEDTGKPILKPRTAEMAAVSDDPNSPKYDTNSPNYKPAITAEQYGTAIRKTAPYNAPELNIISCTYIREVFGGGLGETAIIYGNPTVNINMEPGALASQIDRDGDGTADGVATALGEIGGIYKDENNEDVQGGVYGGGDAAPVYGNTTVNIGTATTVQMTSVKDENGVLLATQPTHTVTGAYITGNVYGGGKLADVGETHLAKDSNNKDIDVIDIEGSTFVNIGAVKGTEILDAQSNPTGRYNYTSVSFTPADAPGIFIGGNVYGGGKGEAAEPEGTNALPGAFRCGKAMVTKNTNVAIGNGTIGDGNADHGHVYGGGEKGRVEENTSVTIGCENDENSKPVITGNVFGAGKGVNTHGYSALARGNSYVTVQGEAKVKKSVYGGGEIASVGKYNIVSEADLNDPSFVRDHPGLGLGMPWSLANQGSGYCYVTVRDDAVIGPDAAMVMTATGYPDDMGHVFGAGKGVLPYEGYADNEKAWRVTPGNTKQEYLSKSDAIAGTIESSYLPYVETLGLATQTYVTIDENAFVKGSVYGGSENGYVQHDTQVNIKGYCQIGNGYVQMDNDGVYLSKLETPETPMGVNRRYTDAEWDAGKLIPDETNESELYALVHDKYYTSSLPECASWPYGQATGADKYAPWDKYANVTGYDSKGGRTTADDGHTFYGNVFGGGSGVIPYRPGKWHPEAGSVGGNTEVNITGGHILTNIYGGNELTDVYGKCTVNFGGTATLGVPRTLKQIAAHPLTCYLFGAGKGDQRVLFNKKTNVKDVEVNITGGTIYGSVFGGGEDGHVHRDVKMTIGKDDHSGPTIGQWGTSYVDGNIFGGGRGFGADAYTAGNVAGSVNLEIKGGSILGSVYGGGRLGSVGYGLFESTNTANYGVMQDDNKDDEGNTTNFYKDGDVGLGRGHIDITISGGTIGNNREYIIPNTTPSTGNAPSELDNTDFKAWTTEQWTAWKEHNSIPKTEFDTTTGQLTHTKGGNVFAGGMGNFFKQDGKTYINGVDWWKLGNAKSTKVTITGGTIKSNVYGGGELGQVVGHHTTTNAAGESINASTEISISGSETQIGTEVVNGGTTEYTFGSIFGGGYGSLLQSITVNDKTSYPRLIAGLVKKDTKIDMQGGAVKASIYGGGEMASVGEKTSSGGTTTLTGSAFVIVRDGTVGIAPIEVSEGTKRYFGGAKMGNVYGGGSGSNDVVRSGRILMNTSVNISGGTIYHNIYGGGAYGTVGDFEYDEDAGNNYRVIGVKGLATEGTGVANVTITGGTIGYDGKENGMVFGSSRGDINRPGERDDYTAWVYDTHVTIGTEGSETGPQINGTVYGSGENGHVFSDTEVNVHNGTIGIASGSAITYTENGQSVTKGGAEYPYRGNVYGGGCGTDKYYENHALETHDGNGQLFNSLAGIVYGTTTVNITGGTVVRNVYGAGAMGSVGKTVTTTNESSTTTTITGGTTTIKISGGTIGVDGTNGDGNVFGAARGDADAKINEFALVKKETGVSVTGGTIKGNVYGGGELGCVGTFTVSPDMRTFTWQDTDGDPNPNTAANSDNKNTGVCNVTVDGSSAVINGHVYGAGKGKEDTFWCEKGIAYSTNVNIKNGTVNQNVYGGGEVGRVETDTQVKIGNGTGTAGGTSAPTITGSVFGGGAGVETHGYSALVRGNTTVTVEGNADVRKSIYGGGMIASVGRYGLDEHDMPSILQGGGYCFVTVQGSAQIGEGVFGAGKGVTPAYTYVVSDDYDVRMNNSKRMVPYSPYNETTKKGQKESDWKKTWDYVEDYPEDYSGIKFVWEYFDELLKYSTYLETLALATHPEVTIDGNATVSGSVFGGGELGLTKGSVIVTIKGGTIEEDVYGGGSLANTNTTSTVDLDGDGTTENIDPTTTVNLKGGTINRNVYGGGLGQLAKAAVAAQPAQGTEGEEGYVPAVAAQPAVSAVEAKVYGEVLVKLNEPTTTTTGEGESSTTTTTYGDCVVKGTIFGCNNLNGSPQKNVTVHVYKTVTKSEGAVQPKPTKNTDIYEVTAVYGGGNLAAYYPDDATARETAIANVIIDGCDLTSIKSVYGGGNAASVPATEVVVNGTYEIDEVFGGGNGKDKVSYDGGVTYVDNPGANVGLLAYPNAANAPYDTKENRKTNYGYGIGKAHATIYGGTVHTVYGGSNTKGNVREESRTTLEDHEQCTYNVGDAFGGGNNAAQDGDAILDVGCIRGLDIAYGGASNADVNGDVILNIINGTYGRVFGGNNLGGAIRGSILVNIEETGCNRIVIGELYCGGNLAPYSVYGYNDDGSVKRSGDNPVADPVLNVKSFTSIGKIFGGGYGSPATMVANPTVNINVVKGRYRESVIAEGARVIGSELKETNDDGYDATKGYDVPSHEAGAIGAIGSVFGGGNVAEVIGNPTVNIGTEAGDEVYDPVTATITPGTTSVANYYTLTTPASYTQATGNAVEGTTYYQKTGDVYQKVTVAVGADVTNYYTLTSPASYTQATGTAVEGTAYYEKKTVAVDIRDNVFGGGNNAPVTGNTNVVIGKKITTP